MVLKKLITTSTTQFTHSQLSAGTGVGVPSGDNYFRVLMFDSSADLHKSAKFNTCKN